MAVLKLFSAVCLFWVFCFLGLAQTAAAPAQQPPSTPASQQHPPADHRIWLDAVVTDKAGNPISGLQQQDFTLLDGKQPQKIESFEASEENAETQKPPVQVIFLVDAVNISVQTMAIERIQLDKFLRQDGGHLPVPMSLILFTDTTTRMQPSSTRDGNALATLLDANETGLRAIGRSAGFWGAAERADMSMGTLDQLAQVEVTQPGRKLVIWLSPGWPLLSGPGIYLSDKDKEVLFHRVVALSVELRQSRITLYAVDPEGTNDSGSFRTFYYETFLKGVTAPKNVNYGNLGLQVLATQSGGRVLNSNNDIAKEIANCVRDARAFYTLSFEAPPADHPNEYHSLELKVDKPGMAVRTSTGYYAQPYKNDAR